jgi:hydroxyethylthiazole kinase
MTDVSQQRWLSKEDARVVSQVAARRPRVQCLTNTVAQALTANVLHALGARASMALHAEEVVAMSASADALLINLGTIDDVRLAAIERLVVEPRIKTLPIVLDPVFVEHSPVRASAAARVLSNLQPIVKGNRTEMAALASVIAGSRPRAIVETGSSDRILVPGQPECAVTLGHPWMADVTGLGCALGAVIAACDAVANDVASACRAAVTVFGLAGAHAGAVSRGPGSFAVAFIDALSQLARNEQAST